jgi:hypothetical protein
VEWRALTPFHFHFVARRGACGKPQGPCDAWRLIFAGFRTMTEHAVVIAGLMLAGGLALARVDVAWSSRANQEVR